MSVKDDDCDTQDPEELLGLAPNTGREEGMVENKKYAESCEPS